MVRKATSVLWFVSLMLIISCGTDGTKKFNDEKGKFSIAFSEAPEISQVTQSSALGEFETVQFKISPKNDDNLLYSVQYVDYPKSFTDTLSKEEQYSLFLSSQRSIASTIGMTSTGLQNISIQGYFGRQFRWNNTTAGELLKLRVYLVENRLYTLMVKTPLKNNFNKKIDEFLDSFELIDTQPNPNAEEVVVKENNYTVDFPGPTESRVMQSTTPSYGDISVAFEGYQPKLKSDQNVFYGFGTSTYTKDITQLLNFDLDSYYEEAIQTALASRQTTLIRQKKITQNGLEGVEIEESFRGGQAVITNRMFLNKDVLISIQVITPAMNKGNADIGKFLDSFRLK